MSSENVILSFRTTLWLLKRSTENLTKTLQIFFGMFLEKNDPTTLDMLTKMECFGAIF